MDDVYDIAQKLDEEKFDYLIVALKKNKKGTAATGTILFNLEDDASKRLLFQALTKFKKTLKKK